MFSYEKIVGKVFVWFYLVLMVTGETDSVIPSTLLVL